MVNWGVSVCNFTSVYGSFCLVYLRVLRIPSTLLHSTPWPRNIFKLGSTTSQLTFKSCGSGICYKGLWTIIWGIWHISSGNLRFFLWLVSFLRYLSIPCIFSGCALWVWGSFTENFLGPGWITQIINPREPIEVRKVTGSRSLRTSSSPGNPGRDARSNRTVATCSTRPACGSSWFTASRSPYSSRTV